MLAECNQRTFSFHALARREVLAAFNGGRITTDAGVLLLGQVDQATGILAQFAKCFHDHRHPQRIEHTREQLIRQRVLALAMGYEDLNDHDTLRHDPLLATLVGHDDPLGDRRRRQADRGVPLAGKSTLNRLELTPVGASVTSRYKKIRFEVKAFEKLLVDLFLQAHTTPPSRIVLDIDATDDPIHGHQLGKFFHGYYDCHCYLPLYVTCGHHVLCAKLRPANIDGAKGAVGILSRIIGQIREAWPQVQILVRGDSGFCREPLMRWCEEHDTDYLLGLAKNKRLLRSIGRQMHEAEQTCQETGKAARVFADLAYRTQKSWSRTRRVVGKAEHLPGARGENPRFVVTNLPAERWKAQALYEEQYCARGEMENRIKEQQLDLFADRTSAGTMRANQLRLALSTIAYTLLNGLRRLGLKGTGLAEAQCGTIRTRLLKLGARVVVTTRKVWVHLSESFALQSVFAAAHRNLSQLPQAPLGP